MRQNGFQVLFCWSQLASLYVLLIIPEFSTSAKTAKMPSLLIISFDGFRWDYLTRTSTPHFDKFLESGVFARKGLESVFPSVTLTSHWSIVTGLYPESHGIIDNIMYDPIINKTYIPLYKDKDAKNDIRFYDHNGAEPIWVTNSLQYPERKSGSIMWWGAENEIKGIKPFYHMPYDEKKMNNIENIDTLVDLFSSATDPINLGLLYFGEPDETGHEFGPDSDQVTKMIATADLYLGYILEQFDRLGLLDGLNIIITSDHGMAPLSRKRLIHLDDIVDKNWYKVVHLNPIATIIPNKGKEEKVYKKLLRASKDNHFQVFKRENIPERFHYKNNRRVTPIVAIADVSYVFISNETDEEFTLAGTHGYDNKYSEMRPFFMASGPSFKKNVSVESFSLVDLYPLMCHLLDLTPAPNNGSVDIVSQLLVHQIEQASTGTSIYIQVFGVLAGVALILFACIWRRRRYLRYRLKQLTPEVWQQGRVTIAWPVTYPKVTVTKASGPQMPLMINYSDESDDEF